MLHCMNHLASIRQHGTAAGWLLSRQELEQVGFYNPLRAIGVGAAEVQRLLRDGRLFVHFDGEKRLFRKAG